MYLDQNFAYVDIVHQQMEILNMTGLFSRLDAMYYVTVGRSYQQIDTGIASRLGISKPLNEINSFRSNHRHLDSNDTISNVSTNSSSEQAPKVDFHQAQLNTRLTKLLHLHNSIPDVDESLTLAYLHNFCLTHPRSIVLYFHDKGSYHSSSLNVFFRNFLDCYVLNPNCLDTLLNSDLDTCGWRFTPVPNMHYSGNFWWAKCSYVSKLVNPESMAFNETFAQATESLSPGIVSSKRYLSEAWIGSGPWVKPADCMSYEIDEGSYLCGYELNGISIEQCPNHYKHYEKTSSVHDYFARVLKNMQALASKNDGTLPLGSPCGTAQVILHPTKFLKAYERERGGAEHGFHIDLVEEMRKRSKLWYGEEPHSYLNITKGLALVDPKLKSLGKAFVIESHTHQKFLYDHGKIYDSKKKEFKDATQEGNIPKMTMLGYKIEILKHSSKLDT